MTMMTTMGPYTLNDTRGWQERAKQLKTAMMPSEPVAKQAIEAYNRHVANGCVSLCGVLLACFVVPQFTQCKLSNST